MDRGRDHDRYGRALGIALLLSIAFHVALLSLLDVDIVVPDSDDSRRAPELIDLSDAWVDQPLEVITLVSDRPSGVADQSEATSARAEAVEPGAAGADAAVAAILPNPGLPGAAAGNPGLSLDLAEAVPSAEIAVARSNRGVVLRSGGGGALGDEGMDFVAASDAAREAERRRGGGGRGGLGGIGEAILGGGGEGYCPPWHDHGLGGGDMFGPHGPAPPLGGGGAFGLPRTGPGRGIVGRRPPGGEAINRRLPTGRIP